MLTSHLCQSVSVDADLVSVSSDNALSPTISGTGPSYDLVVWACLAIFSHSIIVPQSPDFAFACAFHTLLTAVMCRMHATSDSLAHPVARLAALIILTDVLKTDQGLPLLLRSAT